MWYIDRNYTINRKEKSEAGDSRRPSVCPNCFFFLCVSWTNTALELTPWKLRYNISCLWGVVVNIAVRGTLMSCWSAAAVACSRRTLSLHPSHDDRLGLALLFTPLRQD